MQTHQPGGFGGSNGGVQLCAAPARSMETGHAMGLADRCSGIARAAISHDHFQRQALLLGQIIQQRRKRLGLVQRWNEHRQGRLDLPCLRRAHKREGQPEMPLGARVSAT